MRGAEWSLSMINLFVAGAGKPYIKFDCTFYFHSVGKGGSPYV